MDLFFLILGVVLVLWGADKLTDGATGLARRFQVNDLVIGLTVVAFGTSLPEFVTSLFAAIKGSSAISLGNVIGSNIFNVFFVLGICSFISPMNATSVSLTDIFILIFSMLLMWGFASTSRKISRWEGLVMVVLYCSYVTYLILNL